MGHYQVLPLQVRVELGVMTVNGYSTFPKATVQKIFGMFIILAEILYPIKGKEKKFFSSFV